jgi:hypothetical protein
MSESTPPQLLRQQAFSLPPVLTAPPLSAAPKGGENPDSSISSNQARRLTGSLEDISGNHVLKMKKTTKKRKSAKKTTKKTTKKRKSAKKTTKKTTKKRKSAKKTTKKRKSAKK